jgi:hypothetical protein
MVARVLQECRALRQTPWHRKDQGHRHVGGVLGQHAGRVGDNDSPVAGGIEVDVVDTGPEIGDQLQVGSGLRQDGPVDAVGHRRDQDLRSLNGSYHLRLRQRVVVNVQSRVEQLAHAGFDDVGQLTRDNDDWLSGACRHRGPLLPLEVRGELVGARSCLLLVHEV